MYDTIPQIESIVETGDGHTCNWFTFYRPVALTVFSQFLFYENPLFFSRFQKLRGRGNIFVFLEIQIFQYKFKLLSVYS